MMISGEIEVDKFAQIGLMLETKFGNDISLEDNGVCYDNKSLFLWFSVEHENVIFRNPLIG